MAEEHECNCDYCGYEEYDYSDVPLVHNSVYAEMVKSHPLPPHGDILRIPRITEHS